MNRRIFIKNVLGAGFFTLSIIRCGKDTEILGGSLRSLSEGTVTLYDTHAMALYFDGGLGPKTGIVRVEYVLANEPVEMEFWHGHGGRNHRFTLTPDHFAELKQLKRVYLQTDEVAGHSHRLFIDPTDIRYRVAGALPVEVPLQTEIPVL